MLSSSSSQFSPMEIKSSTGDNNEGGGVFTDKNRRVMRFVRRYKRHLAICVPLSLLFLAILSNEITSIVGNGKNGIIKNSKLAICRTKCRNFRARDYQRYNNEQLNGRDMLNRTNLLQLVTTAKERLIQQLKIDYGEEHFTNIFVNNNDNNNNNNNNNFGGSSSYQYRPFVPSGDKSRERLRRKLMIKILSTQKKFTQLQQQQKALNGCDCTYNNGDTGNPYNPEKIVDTNTYRTADEESESSSTKFPSSSSSLDDDDDTSVFFEKYIWATGGHSAAAGHGNLFNESYTAFMERDVKDIFGSIGIDFQARNHAMGGTGSAAEIAMCWEEIFGTDVDMFSWDYYMTDAGQPHRLLHYAYRGAISKGRPAFMGIRINLARGEQDKMVKFLTDLGISIFIQDMALLSEMEKAIPDTLDLTTKEIDAMPEYVKNFKCNDFFEKGEPFCEEEKYSRDVCEDREGKAPWHPGIKSHAMDGHALALFLVENLIAALEELIELESESMELLLSRLQQEEVDLYENHMVDGVDFQDYPQELYSVNPNNEIQIDLDASLFLKGKSMCHTARLPSQTRYLGYLTNSSNDKVGGPAPFGKETFDVGIEEKEASPEAGLMQMQLVWSDGKMHQKDCPVIVNIDHKDSFFSQKGNGWNTIAIPNEAERRAYNYDPSLLQGVVVLVFTTCDWGKCEESYAGPDDFGKIWEMKINGLTANSLVPIGHDALLVTNEDGLYYFPSSHNNDYKIEIQVNEPSKTVKISSFVVY